jgi:hypothetical protein
MALACTLKTHMRKGAQVIFNPYPNRILMESYICFNYDESCEIEKN